MSKNIVKNKNQSNPINIYAIRLDDISSVDNGDIYNRNFSSVVSYAKYMGYTHLFFPINGNDVIYNRGEETRRKELSSTLHSAGIKMICEIAPKDITETDLYVYIVKEQVKEFGYDGIYINASMPQYCNKKLFKTFNDSLHCEFKDFITLGGHSVNTCCNDCGFDYVFDTELYLSALDYLSVDPIYRSYKQESFEKSLFDVDGKKRIIPLSPFSIQNNVPNIVNGSYGQYSDRLRQLRIYSLLSMTLPGKKLTVMGTEFANPDSKSTDWNLLQKNENRDIRSFIRELNTFYLSNKILFENESINTLSVYEGYDKNTNVVAFKRVSNDYSICVVINFSGASQSVEIKQDGIAEYIFSSELSVGQESINQKNNAPGVYTVTLPAFSGAIYRFK